MITSFRKILVIVWSIGILLSGLSVAFVGAIALLIPCDAPAGCSYSLSDIGFLVLALVPFVVFVGGVIGGLRPERTRWNDFLLLAPFIVIVGGALLYIFDLTV